MAVQSFSDVPNKGIAPPSYEPDPYRPEDLGTRLLVVPVKDARTVELTWLLPPVQVCSSVCPLVSGLVGWGGYWVFVCFVYNPKQYHES